MLYNAVLKSAYSQESMNSELVSFYEKWKTRYLRRVKDTAPLQEYLFYTFDQPSENQAVTCSEAMGYGMFIFPMMFGFDKDARKHFDALYRYVLHFPSCYNPYLMAWQQVKPIDDIIVNSSECTSSATDGDMDITYGLLLAHCLWGKTDRTDNYFFDAQLRMNALMTSCVCSKKFIILLGDWVLGIDRSPYKNVTRSSDFMTYLIKKFMQIDQQNRHLWERVLFRIHSIVAFQMKRQSQMNGLMPDFFIRADKNYIAPKNKVLESDHDGDYYYNSCRIPWRYAMDPIIYSIPLPGQLHTLNKWVIQKTQGNPSSIMSGYYLANGIPGTSFGTPGQLSYIAPFLVSALAESGNDAWKLALWNFITKIPIDCGTFYDNTLKLIALIVATGNWISPDIVA